MKQQQIVPDSIEHISDRPWSEITKADYTLEQWHAACLIHLHDGPPTSKGECKLPVKTPGGALNRNGVHAAAAVLAGARGGVNAPSDKTAAARRSIVRLYSELGEKPPPSMTHGVEDILEHHGVKGMRWGVRKTRSIGGGVRPVNKQYTSRDFQTAQALKSRKPSQLTNKQLKTLNDRMNLEQNYKRLNPRVIDKGHNRVKYMLAFAATAGTAVAATSKVLNTPTGKRLMKKGERILLNKKAQRMAVKLGHL